MKKTILGSLAAMSLWACGPAATPADCTADTYPAEGFSTNAAGELELRNKLKALNDAMKAAEASVSVKPTVAELAALYAAGTPSLQSVTAEPYRAVVDDVFTRFVAAAGNTWTPANPPTGTGGIFGAYIFSERGADLRQVMEKGLFGAAHYAEAARLMTATATAADVDRMVALFGANPSFPMNDKDPTNPDVHTAVYAKRRTNAAAATPGPYLAIKQAFMNARKSVTVGTTCATQRDEAFTQIRAQWERALVGTVVFYLTSAANTLEKASPTDAERAGALHGIGEAVGFLTGLRALPAASRTVTDAQLDQLLTTLKGASLANAELHLYLTDSVTSVDSLTAAISQIQSAWQLSAEEINAFKTNY